MDRPQLDQVNHLEAAIAQLDARIEKMVGELFQCWPDLLTTVPGIGRHATAAVTAEIGVAIRSLPRRRTPGLLDSAVPGNRESAARRCFGKPRKGRTYLQTLLVECAWSAVSYGARPTGAAGLPAACGRLPARHGLNTHPNRNHISQQNYRQ
jgi:transposase